MFCTPRAVHKSIKSGRRNLGVFEVYFIHLFDRHFLVGSVAECGKVLRKINSAKDTQEYEDGTGASPIFVFLSVLCSTKYS